MATANVIPNAECFKLLCKGRKQHLVAKELMIAENTLRRLINGHPVAEHIIKLIAKFTNRPIGDLTVQRPDSLLPNDPRYYTSLRFGWWIGPHDDGNNRWFRETVDLKPVKGRETGTIAFKGTITNQLEQVFEVRATHQNNSHFSLTAKCDDGTTWDGCLMLRKNGVLCGIWSGYPSILEPKVSIYRYFMSVDELGLEDLKRISREVKIENNSEADSFA